MAWRRATIFPRWYALWTPPEVCECRASVSVGLRYRISPREARATLRERKHVIQKRLIGCSVFVVLLVAGIALLAGVDWDQVGGENGSGGEEAELGRELAAKFGNQPTVEFVCSLPVVGEAPCLPGQGAGTRDVTLTFSDYELPTGIDPQEHARRIALAAHEVSAFVRDADRTEIVFYEGDESASVLRKYSFAAEALTITGATEED